MSVDVERLGKVSVLDLAGARVPLATVWSDHPVVLVFVRHFG